jgi:hypothetical protein
MSCFSPPKNDRQRTSFTTHFTTTSPQKHHAKHALFAKTPSKNPHFTTPKKNRNFNPQMGVLLLSKAKRKRKLVCI